MVLASGRAATVDITGSGLISAVVAPGAAGSVTPAVLNSWSADTDATLARLDNVMLLLKLPW